MVAFLRDVCRPALAVLFATMSTSPTDNVPGSLPPLKPSVVPKERYDALVEWMKGRGMVMDDRISVEESELGDGCGLCVKSPLKEKEVVFRIPRSACITLTNATTDRDIGQDLMKLTTTTAGKTMAMVGYLAKNYLLADESPLQVYFSTLPWKRGINYQEHTLFWTEHQIREVFSGTPFLQGALRLLEQLKMCCATLKPVLQKFGSDWSEAMIEDAISGACVILSSRGFHDGPDGEVKLIPVMGMMQHDASPNLKHLKHPQTADTYDICTRNVAVGEELVISYVHDDDNWSAFQWFLVYGFIPGVSAPIEELARNKSSELYE